MKKRRGSSFSERTKSAVNIELLPTFRLSFDRVERRRRRKNPSSFRNAARHERGLARLHPRSARVPGPPLQARLQAGRQETPRGPDAGEENDEEERRFLMESKENDGPFFLNLNTNNNKKKETRNNRSSRRSSSRSRTTPTRTATPSLSSSPTGPCRSITWE